MPDNGWGDYNKGIRHCPPYRPGYSCGAANRAIINLTLADNRTVMTSINIPRDDAASRIDTKAVSERTVQQTNPYPTVQPVKAHEETTKAPLQPPRKQTQRRKNERRKSQQAVLLDTRSGRDRRNAAQNTNIELEGDKPADNSTGIDVYS